MTTDGDNYHDRLTMASNTVSEKRPGRPPKYDWSDKKDLCYRLYVEEQRPLREIVDIFATQFGINQEAVPS